VELMRDPATREPDAAMCEALIARAADEGLLVLSCGHDHNVIRFIPPINVTAEEIEEGLAIFGRALRSLPTRPDAAGA
jgi:4-aminobutyrate aminotransferase/(S)-3-amino-2-methylpropionate transaminase